MTALEKFKLVLKTTNKKLVLKYHDNARFPSLCLATENEYCAIYLLKKQP